MRGVEKRRYVSLPVNSSNPSIALFFLFFFVIRFRFILVQGLFGRYGQLFGVGCFLFLDVAVLLFALRGEHRQFAGSVGLFFRFRLVLFMVVQMIVFHTGCS